MLEPVDSGEPVVSSSAPSSSEPVAETSSTPVGETPPPPVVSGPDEEQFLLAPRIDVEVGIVDRDRRQTIAGVKSGDLLPSKEAPVAMFLGNNDQGSVAEFLVSRDVSRVNGEGECEPGRNNCEFLRLNDGDSAYLRFADGKRYVISVKDIYFKRVPKNKADKAE